jgi:hypothetical protein
VECEKKNVKEVMSVRLSVHIFAVNITLTDYNDNLCER